MEFKLKGDAAYREKKWLEASKLYSTAFNNDSSLVTALSNKAACAIQLQDWNTGLEACTAALNAQTGVNTQLKTKLLYRKAVCLRHLHLNKEEWTQTVLQGLELDPLNESFKSELSKLFVSKVKSMPKQYTSSPNIFSEQERTISLPSLPLTYSGLTQLLRSTKPEVYKFWYDQVSGADLKNAVKAGVEPSVLEYVYTMIEKNPMEAKNKEFAQALIESPRYSTAAAMTDKELVERCERI